MNDTLKAKAILACTARKQALEKEISRLMELKQLEEEVLQRLSMPDDILDRLAEVLQTMHGVNLEAIKKTYQFTRDGGIHRQDINIEV